MAAAVPTHDAEPKAVGSRPAGHRGHGHAEECDGRCQVGGQRQVVEGDGLGQMAAGSAVHGAGVSFTLTGSGRQDRSSQPWGGAEGCPDLACLYLPSYRHHQSGLSQTLVPQHRYPELQASECGWCQGGQGKSIPLTHMCGYLHVSV